MSKFKIIWSGLADERYWNDIARFCVPSWEKLDGEKYIVSDTHKIDLKFINLTSWDSVVNRDSNFLKLTDRLKPMNFWRKMQSQVWAIRNLSNCDFLVLLDTDIEILDFDHEKFDEELEKFKDSGLIWATGESNRRGHDSGFIILNTAHPQLKELTDFYENIWESGDIFKLAKWYDGHAVESMFEKYPSYKIRNRDYGNGFHLYSLGMIHYGSKIPKKLRAEWVGDGKSLVESYLSTVTIKKYKSDI